MSSIYFAIGCNGDNILTTGFEFSNILRREAPSETFVTEEIYLAQTGWHENSHRILVAGTSKEEVSNFIEYALDTFDKLLVRKYEVEKVEDIIFDDESLEVHFEVFIDNLQGGNKEIIRLDKEQYFYEVL